MATIKSYTNLEQSKKLAEILPLESADMIFDGVGYKLGIPKVKPCGYVKSPNTLPCWSLAALLGVLPYPYIEQNYKGKWTCRVEHGNTTYLWEDSNPIDACYELILKLHELNLL